MWGISPKSTAKLRISPSHPPLRGGRGRCPLINMQSDELLNGEIFDTLLEARVLTERWRREYNKYRPHSSLGYKPPAPEAYEAKKLFMQVVH